MKTAEDAENAEDYGILTPGRAVVAPQNFQGLSVLSDLCGFGLGLISHVR
jgi:hypothetical protein